MTNKCECQMEMGSRLREQLRLKAKVVQTEKPTSLILIQLFT